MSTLPNRITSLRDAIHSQGSKGAAREVVKEYFGFLTKPQIDEDLWYLLVAALSSDLCEELKTGCKRQDVLFFYEYTQLLMDSVYLLHQAGDGEKEGSGTKHPPAAAPPWTVIHNYFSAFHLPEVERGLRAVYHAYLTTEDTTPLQRSNALYDHEHLAELLHAVYALHLQHQTPGRP